MFLATLIVVSKCQNYHRIPEVQDCWEYLRLHGYLPEVDCWKYYSPYDSWKYSSPHDSTYFGIPNDRIFNGAFTIGNMGNLERSGQFENTEYQRIQYGDPFANIDRVNPYEQVYDSIPMFNQHQASHLRQIDPIEVLYPVEVDVPIAVDTPYPVEVSVREPYEVPVHVLIDKPYPVEVPLPYKVPFPVEREVRVQVDNPVPFKVDVEIPVDVPIPVPVEVPEGVPYPIEILVPVAYEVEVPYYAPYDINVDVPIEVPVAVDVPLIIPYPVEVLVDVPYEVRVPIEVPYQVPYEVSYGVPVPVDVPVPVEVQHPVEVIVPSKEPGMIPIIGAGAMYHKDYRFTDSGNQHSNLKSFFPLQQATTNDSDSSDFGTNFLPSKHVDFHRGFSGTRWHGNMFGNMIPRHELLPDGNNRNMVSRHQFFQRGNNHGSNPISPNYFSDSSNFGTNFLPPKYVYFNNRGSRTRLNDHSYVFDNNNMVPQVGNNVYEGIVPNYMVSNLGFPFPNQNMDIASELNYFPFSERDYFPFSERERVFGNSMDPSMSSSYPSYLAGSGLHPGFWQNTVTLNGNNNMFGRNNPAFNAYPKFVAFTNVQSLFFDPYLLPELDFQHTENFPLGFPSLYR